MVCSPIFILFLVSKLIDMATCCIFCWVWAISWWI